MQLAIVAVIAYVAYTQLWPRFRSYRQAPAAEQPWAGGAESARQCVSAAESVIGDFALGIRPFLRPPADPGLWSTFMIETSGRLSSADSACRCPEEACASAGGALLEQRRLLNQLDGVVRGTSSGTFNPAVSTERINGLLSRARAEIE